MLTGRARSGEEGSVDMNVNCVNILGRSDVT